MRIGNFFFTASELLCATPPLPNSIMAQKRKAVTKDAPEADEVALSDGRADADNLSLDGAFSQSGSDVDSQEDLHLHEELEVSSDEDDLDDAGDEDAVDAEASRSEPIAGAKAVANSTAASSGGVDDEFASQEDAPNYTVTTDANGNPRYLYPPIDPVYDSDDTDAQGETNTIGNIPLAFYDAYPHIGYNINGKKIARPAAGAALDQLLDSIELPPGWTGLTDPSTGKPIELTPEELELVRRIQMREYPDADFDPYPATVEYFSGTLEPMPLSAAPEPKRRFVPSKHEARRVAKLVRAIQQGRIMPYKPPAEDKEEEDDVKRYDIWANEAPRPDHPMNIPAPKLPPPGYEESYHPPPEYLPDAAEKKAWEDANVESRERDFLPANHDALRKVPGYERFVKEKFDRCLDLYLAPRVRRKKLDIDPESLLPKLPDPNELKPFPTTCATLFRGHKGRVRSVAIDPSGTWLATGGDDGALRVWELLTGRQAWHLTLGNTEAVDVVRWRPGTDAFVLAAGHGEDLYLIIPPIIDPEIEAVSHALVDAGFGHAASKPGSKSSESKPPPPWSRPSPKALAAGARTKVTLRSPIKHMCWHRRGAHLCTVSPRGASAAVAVHTLAQHRTQFPFRRLRGLAQAAVFHPAKPVLLVATQRLVRAYDLTRQELVQTLRPGARWISALDVHPRQPDNVLVAAYDRRTLWMDAELATTPYKTLRYHDKAVRAARFHSGAAAGAGGGARWAQDYPLFADASDDGTVQVFHGSVVDDLMANASIVPLKVLRGHGVVGQLGVLDLDWHPALPWLVSAGADGTCRLWT